MVPYSLTLVLSLPDQLKVKIQPFISIFVRILRSILWGNPVVVIGVGILAVRYY